MQLGELLQQKKLEVTKQDSYKREKQEDYFEKLYTEYKKEYPRFTKKGFLWKRIVPSGKSSAQNLQKLYLECESKVKHDGISWGFAINILTNKDDKT